jgi:protein gp37
LFHKDVPLSFIKEVFFVMNDNPQHHFQILTKRPEVLLKYNDKLHWTNNIWMGVSVEDERVVNRIDYLRKTDAHIKFLSLEPLIGPLSNLNLKNIHWVIVGGESGHHARPIKKEWVKEIKEQCDAAEVKFFFKQWGKPSFNDDPKDPTINKEHPAHAKGGSQLEGKIYKRFPLEI